MPWSSKPCEKKPSSVSAAEGRGPPPLPANWTRCHMYMAQKRRYCRQEPVVTTTFLSNQQVVVARYCGNHQPDTSASERIRIPCPFDPTHQIYQDQLDGHKKKCPLFKKLKTQQELLFFNRNVNAGGHGQVVETDPKSSESFVWAKQLALRVTQAYEQVKDIPLVDLATPELLATLGEGTQHYHIRSGGPLHLHQQASLIGHLFRIGAFTSPTTSSPADESCASSTSAGGQTTVILEVGAGRGITGLLAAGVAHACSTTTTAACTSLSSSSTQLIMVDRGGSRGKAETVLRRASKVSGLTYMNLRIDWKRVTCDLKHVDVKMLLESSSKLYTADPHNKLVVIAKHLCGCGTDLALKSMVPICEQVTACVLATCCHGLCTWDDYVGREYLCRVMGMQDPQSVFGRREFDLLCRWSAGTVSCRDKRDTVDDCDSQGSRGPHAKRSWISQDPSDSLSIARIADALNLESGPSELGRACQRLLDYGRREYLCSHVFHGAASAPELLYYVPPSITPQNAVLVASRM